MRIEDRVRGRRTHHSGEVSEFAARRVEPDQIVKRGLAELPGIATCRAGVPAPQVGRRAMAVLVPDEVDGACHRNASPNQHATRTGAT